jgi:integrase
MATIKKRVGKKLPGQKPKVSYQARVRRLDYPTETMTFDTKQEAQDWASGLEDRMVQSRHVVDKNSRRVTLEQVIKEYLKLRVPSLKGHQPRYETLDWKKRPLAKRIIGSITVADVIDWIDERLEDQVGLYQRDRFGKLVLDQDGSPKPGKNPRPIKPKTVINELRRLSAIFSWAHSELEMHALVNPVQLVPEARMPKAKGRDRRLKRGELRQILMAAKQDDLPLIGRIVEFAVETACRRAEIAKLRLRHYDADNCVVWVHDTNNDEDRDVGLSHRAKQILDQIIEERGLEDPDAKFFPVDPDEISRAFCLELLIGNAPFALCILRALLLREGAYLRLLPGTLPAPGLLGGCLDLLLRLGFVLEEKANSPVQDGRAHRKVSIVLSGWTAVAVGVDAALEVELAKRLQGCIRAIRADPVG